MRIKHNVCKSQGAMYNHSCIKTFNTRFISLNQDRNLVELNMIKVDTTNDAWRREWQATPIFLPGESHGQRSLAGYNPQGCKESDVTEQLTLTN